MNRSLSDASQSNVSAAVAALDAIDSVTKNDSSTFVTTTPNDTLAFCSEIEQVCQALLESRGKRRHPGSDSNNNKRQKTKHVHFTNQAPIMLDCTTPYYKHDDEGLHPAEIERLKAEIWCSKEDYKRFLEDRMATIQVWWRRQGSPFGKDLEDFYCLRGLEPYQSPCLYNEMLAHRAIYIQTVLEEQWKALRRRQQQARNINLTENILSQVQHMTGWATERALQLAEQDAKEAKRIYNPISALQEQQEEEERASATNKKNMPPPLQATKLARRNSCLSPSRPMPEPRLRMLRRTSSPTLSSYNNASFAVTESLLPPSLRELHRRNRQLMQQIRLQSQVLSHQQQEPTSGYAPLKDSTDATNDRPSLHSLLRAGFQERKTKLSSFTATDFSRRLLQQHQSFQMVRRDSLCGIGGNNNSSNR